MENSNIITDEMFAAVIDGVATPEERRLIYKAIEGDPELREAFNSCIYIKVFEEEIENDFKMCHAADQAPAFDPDICAIDTETETDLTVSKIRRLSLSIDDLVRDSY
ncbi:MAG: hypothetical protein LBT78_03905 [Tannerella sp.]|jgi:hypothetical protein|nr:hypothetical protein [Tannerella sp.]